MNEKQGEMIKYQLVVDFNTCVAEGSRENPDYTRAQRIARNVIHKYFKGIMGSFENRGDKVSVVMATQKDETRDTIADLHATLTSRFQRQMDAGEYGRITVQRISNRKRGWKRSGLENLAALGSETLVEEEAEKYDPFVE